MTGLKNENSKSVNMLNAGFSFWLQGYNVAKAGKIEIQVEIDSNSTLVL